MSGPDDGGDKPKPDDAVLPETADDDFVTSDGVRLSSLTKAMATVDAWHVDAENAVHEHTKSAQGYRSGTAVGIQGCVHDGHCRQ